MTKSMAGSIASSDTTPANESSSSSKDHPDSTPSATVEQDLISQNVGNNMISLGDSIVDRHGKATKNVEQLARDCVNYFTEHKITDPIEILIGKLRRCQQLDQA